MPNLPPQRPLLTFRGFAYLLACIFGLACAIIGASWFVAGRGALIPGFPAFLVEAAACLAGGLMVVGWALARLRREVRLGNPARPPAR